MNSLDAEVIRNSIGESVATRLHELEVFMEIDSTNNYLMQEPAPDPGKFRVALTDNQTAGRGRHGRSWQSPPRSGLCASMAYTFAATPANLSALTLAIGLGIIDTLTGLGIDGVQLKWPNDLIAMDGKLGGILTETQGRRAGAITVVTGIGLNISLTDRLDAGIDRSWAHRVVDLTSLAAELPSRDKLAASIVTGLGKTFVDYETAGFSPFARRWSDSDWLFGREIEIDVARNRLAGVGAGVAEDGALLVDTRTEGVRRVTSGSVVMARAGGRDT